MNLVKHPGSPWQRPLSLLPAAASPSNILWHAFLAALLLTITAPARWAHAQDAANFAPSQAAVNVLQQWYDPGTGLYRTTGWWNSANAIAALANFSRLSGSREYLPVFANTLAAAQVQPDGAPGFINKYYDDEGWWALAWVDVFDLTGDMRYLRQAAAIFRDMQAGWETSTCGGGVWWSKDKRDKNAIENELFLAVAASLANREPDEPARSEALRWAQKEWAWFQSTGMINADHMINDGVGLADPAHCGNNGKATWTYNQGVILGGLIELNRAAPDPSLLRTAAAIADAAIARLSDEQGILCEPGNAHTGGDVPQFKGIFVRNLMLLNAVAPQPRYRAFLVANATALLRQDRNSSGQFGFFWQGPFDQPDAARQSSALDLLIAADSLTKTQPSTALNRDPGRLSNLNIVYLGDSITYGVLLDDPGSQSPPSTASAWIRQVFPGRALFFSNQGHSGHTTVDFLPATATDLPKAEQAASTLLALHPGSLLFSVMLGTNDSAQTGPLGAPVSAQQYKTNLTLIFADLLRRFPQAIIVIQRPTWYSPNTHNHSDYEQPGLDRLQSYFPSLDEVVRNFDRTHPGHVCLGDTQAFSWFSTHHATEMNPESGVNGTFYLHPNASGARALGYFWGSAIVHRMLRGCS